MNAIIDKNKQVKIFSNVVSSSSSRFLHMLIRMLQEQKNFSIVEWIDGQIAIHHPKKLESKILYKYFNHSKYTSFQRQLNNFGFRKMRQVQKGKYEPCFYTNKSTTLDIQSIMGLRRNSMRQNATESPKVKSDKLNKRERRVRFQ